MVSVNTEIIAGDEQVPEIKHIRLVCANFQKSATYEGQEEKGPT